jgi:glycosyltransferase involved in cell wall biosynthesis
VTDQARPISADQNVDQPAPLARGHQMGSLEPHSLASSSILHRISLGARSERIDSGGIVEPSRRPTSWLLAPLPTSPTLAPPVVQTAPPLPGPGIRRRRIARRPKSAINDDMSLQDIEGVISALDRSLSDLKLSEIQNHRLDRELEVLKREFARVHSSKRSTDLDLLEARRSTKELEQRLVKVRQTIAWQLGSSLVDSVQSLPAMARLPKRLLGVFKSSRDLRQRLSEARKSVPDSLMQSAEAAQLASTTLSMVVSQGAERAAAWARAQAPKPFVLANTLIEVAKAVAAEQPLLAASLGSEAIELGPIEGRIKLLAFQLADLGHLRAAATLVDKAQLAGAKFNLSEAKKAEGIRAMLRLVQSPPSILNHRVTPTRRQERRVAIVGREAPPLHSTSAAFRLYDRALHASSSGWKATIILPPGLGRTVDGPHKDERSSDGYVDVLKLKPAEHPEEVVDLYVSASAAAIAAAAVENGCSVIRADGFYTTGVAAALAARSIGCPLIVDIDELLDPNEPFYEGFESTEKGKMQLWMTLMTARAADACIVSNQRIKALLTDVGVRPEQVVVSPHRVLRPSYTREQLAAFRQDLGIGDGPVIGVVRDLCPNYDSTALGDILAQLVPEFPSLKLLVVGSGRAGDALRRRVAEHRLGHALIMVESPRVEDMARYRALMDVSIFTRHNNTKSALVQPYEVVAAMGQGRASVAYQTVDASELMEHGESGLLSPPGDIVAITDNVRTLIRDEGLRARIGQSARTAYEAIAVKEAGHMPVMDLYHRLLAAA